MGTLVINFNNSQQKRIGDPVSKEMFGTNFLFNRDGHDSAQIVSNTYSQFITEANVVTLRYPGGTITETMFDLENPNSHTQNYINPIDKSVTTLSLVAFLDYASNIDATVTIVLPTYRFLNTIVDSRGHRTVSLSDDKIIRDFIKKCLSEAQVLGVQIKAFELGNEWYVDNSNLFGFIMTPIEYGRVASYLANLVQEEITLFRLNQGLSFEWNEPDIAVQVGPGGRAEWYTVEGFKITDTYTGIRVSATELIFNEFDTRKEQAAVDAIITHRYLQGSDSLVDGWAYTPFKTWAELALSDSDFKVAKRYVTEWNVAADNKIEAGIKQFDSLILLFSEMMQAGVDHANIWAVQQRNPTRLIGNSGIGNETWGGLSFGGIAFDLMSAQLRDQYVMLTNINSSIIRSVTFGSDDKIVIFLTNTSGLSTSETVNLQQLAPTFHHGMIVEVSATGVSTQNPLGKANVLVSTDQSRFINGTVSLQFSPNETIMIVLSMQHSGVHIEMYDETVGQMELQTGSMFADIFEGANGNDVVTSRDGNDTLFGNNGNDNLDAGAGHDEIFGGNGADILNGGDGNDLVYGGGGDDMLFGGNQQDSIFGGDGADYILGGSGDDILDGGLGPDTIFGDSGNDRIFVGKGADRVFGGVGTDTLDFSLAEFGAIFDLEIPQSSSGSALGIEVFQIENLDGSNFDDHLTGDSSNNLLSGGRGSDYLSGRSGDDLIMGGSGNDTLAGNNGLDTLDGGLGFDFADYTSSDAAIQVNLGRLTAHGGDASGDILSSIEGLLGSDYNDSLTGNGFENFLSGGHGDDRLDGSSGDDTLFGGSGNDTLIGGNGNDFLYDSLGSNLFFGGFDADGFVFNNDGSFTAIIGDFDVFEKGEKIIFLGFQELNSIESLLGTLVGDGRDSLIVLGDGQTVRIQNVAPADLSVDHFSFFM